MSGIGPNIGLTIAGSVAGTQRSGIDTDRVQANAEAARFRAERDAQASRALGDISEAENTPERDADGRLLYGGNPRGKSDSRDRPPLDHPAHPPDANGERGGLLDLDV